MNLPKSEWRRGLLPGDALMRRFFDVFLFEDVPAADRRADDLYLGEVERCDVFIGLFGCSAGGGAAQRP